MTVLYIDADACPVKEEAERVATRHRVRMLLVSNGGIRRLANNIARRHPRCASKVNHTQLSAGRERFSEQASWPLPARGRFMQHGWQQRAFWVCEGFAGVRGELAG